MTTNLEAYNENLKRLETLKGEISEATWELEEAELITGSTGREFKYSGDNATFQELHQNISEYKALVDSTEIDERFSEDEIGEEECGKLIPYMDHYWDVLFKI